MTYKVLVTLIALICLGCGADTDIDTGTNEGAILILETKLVQIRQSSDPQKLHLDFEVIFTAPPVNLQVDHKDWEQHGNIVSLSFTAHKQVCTGNSPEIIPCPPDFIQEIRKNPQIWLKRHYTRTFVWNTGRKHVSFQVILPIESGIYTPD